MLWTDLRELKTILQIDPYDQSEDITLNFYNEWVPDWIGEVLNRPDFSFQTRTQFLKGTGTQKLTLPYRPVLYSPQYPITVIEDFGANFGSASGSFNTANTLVYGVDYCLQIDQPDLVTSRCAILLRINSNWYRPYIRQAGYLSPFLADDLGSYQVTYSGGFTIDTLPPRLRMAANMLAARLRVIFPLGMEIGGEGYEDRNVNLIADKDDYILRIIKPMILSMRNWKF